MMRRRLKESVVVVLLLSIHSIAFSQTDCYTDVPNVLDCEADALARIIVELSPRTLVSISTKLDSEILPLMFFAASDAFTDVKRLGSNCSYQTYQHLGETARTDKQIGASAKSAGSTSLVEKPGYAQLLGFALEHGAIKQSVDNSVLTLSTSPYAVLAVAKGKDTAQLYQDASFLSRFGASASFNISNETDLLGNASRKQLTEWSVRLRLTGDRSNRGKDFRIFWRDSIRKRVGMPFALENKAQGLLTNTPYFKSLRDDRDSSGVPKYIVSLADDINEFLNGASGSNEVQILRVKQILLCAVKKLAYDPVKRDTELHRGDGQYTVLPAEIRKEYSDVIIPALAASSSEVEVARQLLDKYLKDLDNKPESTFEYTNHRDPMGSDYSELKFLYRMNADALKLNFNGNVSLYNNPNKALNQETIRDFTFALSLEGTAKNPLNRGIDLSKITYSFAGSYERLRENENMLMRKPDIASVQFRLEFPIALGLSIPIAYTYSNNTEMMMKKENKFNVGLHLDIDKLYEISRGSK
jgi:hypothetical protein